MNTEIERLEELSEQFLALHETCRLEAQKSRSRAAALEAENRALTEKLSRVSERLEALLEKLPQEEEG